ncbi:VC0807 family protein [Virgibacillus oceani]|uniref:Uncharacterized protein n=1 Tax=Virgibacillus oceani TaxID=1479511 RepID=A0A917HCH6_9BACI|nr:VC0807 family protein [Virgibacillus oceani]GGG74480.1 hypothetical protein GCM10011398_18960 [Virgibacillus oceani]
MKKNIVILDLICYAAIPYLIWTHGREPFGDYAALLLSTVPGFIYTIYRFIIERQFNIAGMFILGSLFISTTVNLLSSSAESMLWNQVYLGFCYAAIYLLSVVFKKPLALYFAVDWAYLQGYPRKGSQALYSSKGLFIWFQVLTLLFVIRGLFQNLLKAWLIQSYGVDGYSSVLIYMQISGWVFSGLVAIGYFLVFKKVDNYLTKQNYVDSETPVNS